VPITGAATYGADTIAGTVNIILKTDYEGFEANTQYGDNENGNARTFQVSTLRRGNFAGGIGNITFGMEYTKEDGLLKCNQNFLCIDNPGLDSTQNKFLDLDGDGQPDDIDGDGEPDLQSVRLSLNEIRLALFTDSGAITLPAVVTVSYLVLVLVRCLTVTFMNSLQVVI
jgi:iron complex outermembrane receptor protein